MAARQRGRRRLYHYRLASADLALYQYVCTFLTADTGVDQQQIAALGLVVPDALVSSVPTAEQNRATEMDANSSKLSTIDSYVGLIYTLLTNVSNRLEHGLAAALTRCWARSKRC